MHCSESVLQYIAMQLSNLGFCPFFSLKCNFVIVAENIEFLPRILSFLDVEYASLDYLHSKKCFALTRVVFGRRNVLMSFVKSLKSMFHCHGSARAIHKALLDVLTTTFFHGKICMSFNAQYKVLLLSVRSPAYISVVLKTAFL